MKHPAHLFIFTIFILCSAVVNFSFGEDFTYDTREAYMRSGYDYTWSVIQTEFDQRTFDTEEESQQYFDLLDIMVRTGTGYGHTYYSIDLGITQMYPRLLKLDPDPPLYAQYRYQIAIFDRDSTNEQDRATGMALIEIAQRMDEAQYPPMYQGEVWLKAAFVLSSVGFADEKETKDAYITGINLILLAARLDGIEPQYREHVAKKIYNFCYINRSHLTYEQMEQLCYKLFSDPLIDPWIAHAGYGHFLVDKAWVARGKKFGYKVNDAQWEMFRTTLALADKHLTTAWEMRPGWTAPATEMITVSMGQQFHPDRDETFWFNEVTKYQYDHILAYQKMATASRSKWGGGSFQLYTLLDHVLEVSETHKHMGLVFMHVASMLCTDAEDPNELFSKEYYLEQATQLMKAEADEPLGNSFPWTTRGYLELLAMYHFLEGDYEEAAVLLKAGGAKSYKFPKPWKADSRYETYNEILATEFTDEVIKALRAADQGEIEVTLEILKKIDAHFKSQPGDPYPDIISDHKGPLNNLIIHIEAFGRDY